MQPEAESAPAGNAATSAGSVSDAQPVASRPGTVRRYLGLTLAVVLCAGASYGATKFALRDMEVELLLRPRVVVVDYLELAEGLVGRPQEEIDRAIAETRANVDKLQAAGFVVLDAQSVLGAPGELYIPSRHSVADPATE